LSLLVRGARVTLAAVLAHVPLVLSLHLVKLGFLLVVQHLADLLRRRLANLLEFRVLILL